MSEKDHYSYELRQAWLRQLMLEYEFIICTYNLLLVPAALSIRSLKNQWAQWDPLSRCITISEQLVTQYSWDVVIEVLKHEVAHQMVTEVYKKKDAHGQLFKSICERLAMQPWAIRASGDLPEKIETWKDRKLSDKQERLLKKVEKLLALATSSNEHESLLAMQKVRDIYRRYQIDSYGDFSQDTHKNFVKLVISFKRKKIFTEEKCIASILTAHFYVRVIYNDYFDAQTAESYASMDIIGLSENVLMAEYVYHFLRQQIDSLWQVFKIKQKAAGRLKKSFVVGILIGFRKKLDDEKERHELQKDDSEQVTQTPLNPQAILSLRKDELDDFFNRLYPSLKSTSSSSTKIYQDVYEEGQKEGRRLSLSKPVTAATTNRGLLLNNG